MAKYFITPDQRLQRIRSATQREIQRKATLDQRDVQRERENQRLMQIQLQRKAVLDQRDTQRIADTQRGMQIELARKRRLDAVEAQRPKGGPSKVMTGEPLTEEEKTRYLREGYPIVYDELTGEARVGPERPTPAGEIEKGVTPAFPFKVQSAPGRLGFLTDVLQPIPYTAT